MCSGCKFQARHEKPSDHQPHQKPPAAYKLGVHRAHQRHSEIWTLTEGTSLSRAEGTMGSAGKHQARNGCLPYFHTICAAPTRARPAAASQGGISIRESQPTSSKWNLQDSGQCSRVEQCPSSSFLTTGQRAPEAPVQALTLQRARHQCS